MVSAYKNNMKKLLPLGIGFFIAITGLSMVGVFFDTLEFGSTINDPMSYEYLVPAFFVKIFATIVITVKAFNFLFDRKKCDFYHAVPLTRKQLFNATLCAVLTWVTIDVLLPLIFVMAFTLSKHNTNAMTFYGTFFKLILVYLSCIYVCVVTMFAAVCCGNAFNTLFSTVVLLAAPRVLIYIAIHTFSLFVNTGIDQFGVNVVGIFNEKYNIFYSAFMILAGESGFWATPISMANGLVFALPIGIALYFVGKNIFVKRKSEMADTPQIVKPVRLIVMILACAIPALFMGNVLARSIIDKGFTVWEGFILICAIIAYFTLMISYGTEGYLKRTLKFLPVYIGAIALFTVIYTTSVNVAKNRWISEKTEYVEICRTNGWNDTINGYVINYDMLEGIKISDKELIELFDQCTEKSNVYYGSWERMLVKVKNKGIPFYRVVTFGSGNPIELFEKLTGRKPDRIEDVYIN